ncbi:hypothetical protein GlitD10_2910 [Gloeomargarita lithophora Alchichica-D10]|uniref:Uncharacterized protein n=2 Tax=Gloeomargarita TaxID=1188227 RepID=A0A1J0AH59_9CYAN|nr:hypothetical protein GlitD10_2910 [Gloeomargarita lithophora Alchichica-D10]
MYYFGLTSLIVSWPIAEFLHLDLGASTPYQYAFIFGVMGGIWGTYFNRSITLELTSDQPEKLLVNLENKLNEMGFTQSQQQEMIRIYTPRSLQALFMGKIRVLVQKKQVRIVGRAVHIRALQKHF